MLQKRAKVMSSSSAAASAAANVRKIITLFRHGQGEHNVDERYYIRDPILTEQGLQDVEKIRQLLNNGDIDKPDIVLVSPLRRTLMTAKPFHDVFEGSVPVIADELCREVLGKHECEHRFSISEQTKEFGFVDFSNVGSDEDAVYATEEHENSYEKVKLCRARARRFLEKLQDLPYTNIAVVTHNSFSRNVLSVVLGLGITMTCGYIGNGESRSIQWTLERGWEPLADGKKGNDGMNIGVHRLLLKGDPA